MSKQAGLDDPAVLLELRRAIIDFQTRACRVLDEMNGAIIRSEMWLRDVRAREVKQQVLKHETRFGEAKVALLAVKSRIANPMARSHESEERDFLLARAQFEQAEAAMQNIRSWLIKLPRELAGPIATMRHSGTTVDQLCPQAVAQLDRMIAAIERYQDAGRQSSTAGDP